MKTQQTPKEYADYADLWQDGFARGWNVSSWQDIPEIGTRLPRHVDYVGLGPIETVQDQREAMSMAASAAEINSRDYSPFEFTARQINNREDADEAWEAFEAGISAGIEAEIESRLPFSADE